MILSEKLVHYLMKKASTTLFYAALRISQHIPRSKLGRWFFFSIVTPIYELDWRIHSQAWEELAK